VEDLFAGWRQLINALGASVPQAKLGRERLGRATFHTILEIEDFTRAELNDS
jgi:hypothetical protein